MNLKKLRMDHFYDETVAEVSTPVVTPAASIIEPIEQKVEMAPPPPPPVADNTLDNLIDDEGRFMNYFSNDGEGPAFGCRTQTIGTYQNLFITEKDHSSYCPLPQSSAHNSSLGSIIGGSLATPICTESQKTLSEVSIQNHSTPVNTVKS